MTLPNPPLPTLPHKRNLYDKPLNDLQLGLVETANYLAGKQHDVSMLKTEQEGGQFAMERLEEYFRTKKEALRGTIRNQA